MRPFGWPRRSTARAASNPYRSIPWVDSQEIGRMRQTWLTSSKVPQPLAFVSMTFALLVLLAWSFVYLPRHPVHGHPIAASSGSAHAGPPWIYGTEGARFTLVEYADLECPYCQAYFPILRRWIDAHPEVNWQWHHLPLSVHEPATSREARIAE